MNKYSFNPFRWIAYLYYRVKYRHSRWLNYYASVPYNKRYVLKKFREAFNNTKFNGVPMSQYYGVRIDE